jgi:hypothetical protein
MPTRSAPKGTSRTVLLDWRPCGRWDRKEVMHGFDGTNPEPFVVKRGQPAFEIFESCQENNCETDCNYDMRGLIVAKCRNLSSPQERSSSPTDGLAGSAMTGHRHRFADPASQQNYDTLRCSPPAILDARRSSSVEENADTVGITPPDEPTHLFPGVPGPTQHRRFIMPGLEYD